MPRRWVAVAPGGIGDRGGNVDFKASSPSWIRGVVRVTLALAATAILAGQSVHAAPTLECSVDIECSTRDAFSVCDANHSICVCTQGRYRLALSLCFIHIHVAENIVMCYMEEEEHEKA